MTDAEAIAASRTEPAAFVAVFEHHFDEIFRYLRRRIGATLAEELAAETFTQAFAARARYDAARADARPWLYGIAVNLLRHHYRREERQLRAYARTGVDPAGEEDAALASVDPRSGAAVAAALAELEARDRETLLLFAWAELEYGEIAEALGVPVGTVRSRLNRARRRLRELLAASGQLVGEGVDG